VACRADIENLKFKIPEAEQVRYGGNQKSK